MIEVAINFIFLCIAIWIFGSIAIWSIRNGITPMPTAPAAKLTLLKAIPPKVQGNIYELGSGWGTLAMPLARNNPQCTVIGYENSTIPYLFSQLRHLLIPSSNLKIYRKNFFEASLADASLVVCYLYPEAMRKLKDKFAKELKPDTWILSNTFSIPGWEPRQVFDVGDLYNTKIYLYRISDQI
jgi:hypothetical protein